MSSRACLDALRAGRVVAFPTDTFFALSCDPLSDAALARLRELKEIAPGRPLPLLIPPDFDCARIGCVLSEPVRRLTQRFWPGKLTLVVPCDGALGPRVGRRPDFAIGLRVPEGAWLHDLLMAFDGPVVGTSANRTGDPPATTVAEVRRYFSMDQVDSFPGTAPGGAPSTVVSVAGEELVVEREGAVSAAELMQAWSPGTGS